MKLLVYCSNQSEVVEVELKVDEDRVCDLKCAIETKMKISQRLQHLTYDKTFLNNDEKLISYGIKENKVIVLTEIEDPVIKFIKYDSLQVFLCGFAFGLGHALAMKAIRIFLSDVSHLTKKA